MRLNRLTGCLLLVLLFPLVLLTRLCRSVMGGNKKLNYQNTIQGDPLAYSGDRPLLIAVWAPWASIWFTATQQVVDQLKADFSGRCEFAYVECTTPTLQQAYQASVLPMLLIRHRGREVARFVNTLDSGDVRPTLTHLLS
jgi:thioredoxin-like negative regulator of GroEL